jgi:hypothetical protein
VTREVRIDVDAATPLRPYALLEDILGAATGDITTALRAERVSLGLATARVRPALTAHERAPRRGRVGALARDDPQRHRAAQPRRRRVGAVAAARR